MNKKGHTLFELLVAMAVLLTMATIVVVRFVGPANTARDSVRRQALNDYRTAIELFADKNVGLYPSRTVAVSASGVLCSDLSITSCEEDPRNSVDPEQIYMYQTSDGNGNGSPTATEYVLWNKSEKTGQWIVVCSNSKAGTTIATPPYSSCPL